MEWNGNRMERFSVELAKMSKFSYGSIPNIKSKIPFLFHFHSIPLPNPFDNIIVLPNLSIRIPFRFHSNPTNFTSTRGVHFYSIPLSFHFHSISFLFFMNFFFVKGPFQFHSIPPKFDSRQFKFYLEVARATAKDLILK